jgi:hypothetical protein
MCFKPLNAEDVFGRQMFLLPQSLKIMFFTYSGVKYMENLTLKNVAAVKGLDNCFFLQLLSRYLRGSLFGITKNQRPVPTLLLLNSATRGFSEDWSKICNLQNNNLLFICSYSSTQLHIQFGKM